MHNSVTNNEDAQQWVGERWAKHSDSLSITRRFADRDSWAELSSPEHGLNVWAMRSLAAALANEGRPQWQDATRLAWRMAVENADLRSVALIASNLSQLGQGSHFSPDIHAFRHRAHRFAHAVCRAERWPLGQHLVNSSWARSLRNQGEHSDFLEVATQLDSASVLRDVLGAEANAEQRFTVVQSLALYELHRVRGTSRLDWMMGLLSELGADIQAGSTAMRVLLVEAEHALKRGDIDIALIAALQISRHMAHADTELCSRADLLTLLRAMPNRYGMVQSIDGEQLCSEACRTLLPSLSFDMRDLHSLTRDLDRMNRALPVALVSKLPRLAASASGGNRRAVVLRFPNA